LVGLTHDLLRRVVLNVVRKGKTLLLLVLVAVIGGIMIMIVLDAFIVVDGSCAGGKTHPPE